MIIKSINEIYKKQNLSEGVLLNLQIRDINTYYDRFENSLNFIFGLFQKIENELIFVSEIKLKVNEDNQRTGYVQLPNEEAIGNDLMPIEEYYETHKNLDNANVIDYGIPSVELAKTFFTGGTLDNPEIEPVNDLAKQWLLNTLKFDNQPLINNFTF